MNNSGNNNQGEIKKRKISYVAVLAIVALEFVFLSLYFTYTTSKEEGLFNDFLEKNQKPSMSDNDQLVLEKSVYYIGIGNTARINVIKSIDNNIMWYSSKTNIVSVDNSGNVVGLKSGIATVYARDIYDNYVGVTVRVVDLKSTTIEQAQRDDVNKGLISSDNPKATIATNKADMELITPQVINQKTYSPELNSKIINVRMSNRYQLIINNIPSNVKVEWSSSDSSIATVKNGLVEGVKKGSATINAKLSNGKTLTATVNVARLDAAVDVKAITLKSSENYLKVGSTIVISSAITPSNATDMQINWSSSNNNIATVDQGGVVKGISKGTVKITAKTENGISSSIQITVKESVSISCKNSVFSGQNQSIATCNGGTVINASKKIVGSYQIGCLPDSLHYWYSNKTCRINALDINKVNLPKIADQNYTTREVKPDLAMSINNYKLVNGTDYTATYTNNLNSGTASVSITGTNSFTGTRSTTFKIKNNCADISKKIKFISGKAKIDSCLTDYVYRVLDASTNKERLYAFQGISVTDNYYYISGVPRNSTESSEYKALDSSTKEAYLKNMSSGNIRRVSKTDTSNNVLTLVNHSAHNQYFDVYKDGSKDKLVLEQGTKLSCGSDYCRAAFVGLGIGEFKVTNSYNDELIPTHSYYINNSTNKLDVVKYSDYSSKANYYKKVKQIENSSNYSTYDFAVDNENDAIALKSGNTIKIYKFSSFKSGNLTKHSRYVSSFNVPSKGSDVGGLQGMELGGGYLYLVYGSSYEFSNPLSNVVVRRFKLSNGAEDTKNKLRINLANYLSAKSIGDKLVTKNESEGVSYYNGNIYLGIQYYRNGGARVEILKLSYPGWQEIEENGKWNWYYISSSTGQRLTDWQKISYNGKDEWFYLLPSNGAMVTGWKKINYKGKDSWFYFESSGVMVRNTCKTIKSKEYCFNSSGVCIKGDDC